MMFTAGLTAREIADLCKQTIATVHLHLKNRQKNDPDFFTKHTAALEARGPHRITTNWRRRVKEAQYFYAVLGRLPRSTGDPAERSLAEWVAEQRRLFERNDLLQAKIVLLESLPNWNVSARVREREMQWKKNLSLFIAFVDAEQRMPGYRSYATEEEHALGVWLHNQHQRRTENRLELWKLEALNEAVPDWRSRS
ncbi:helicase associated domain-containing protein [Glutamicibacter sp. AGC46]